MVYVPSLCVGGTFLVAEGGGMTKKGGEMKKRIISSGHDTLTQAKVRRHKTVLAKTTETVF